MAAAKRVLRYLCSTSGMGLVLGGRRPVVLTGHADASWADDQTTQRSSQGYTFSLGSGSVSWRSTRSSSVLSSSCEAEIYVGAMAAQELRWLTYLLTDLGEPPRSPPVLYVDNKAMLALCRKHRLEHRTKHIALRYFLARELQQRGQRGRRPLRAYMAPPHSLPLHSSRFSIRAATRLSAALSAACCVLLLASAASGAAPASSLLPSARHALSPLHQPASRDDESSSSNYGSSAFPSTAWSLLHSFLDFDNSNNLGGDSGDSSLLEQPQAARSPPHRLLVAQQQPSVAATAAGVATSAHVNKPPPPPPPAPPLREVELDPCALQALLPQLFPPALLDPACFNHLSLHSAQPSSPLDSPPLDSPRHGGASTSPLSDSGSGGGGGDEPETATRGDLLDVARNKWRASTVWAPLEAEGSAEGAGGAGGTGGAGVARVAGVMGGAGLAGGAGVTGGPGRVEPAAAAASTLTPPNEVITVCRSAGPASITISPDLSGQTWRGWGTSLAWTANYIGKLPDDQLTTLLDLLFSPSTGIGFNLARYLLGASFNATNSPQLTKDTFHQVNLPGYKPTEAGPYDWAADWRQRKVLKGAMERGLDEVEAIAYSAPWWMTISGDTAGNVGGASNLRPDMYGAFAEYLATITDHFQREWNVTFSTMNPANEPLEG
ncbi:unnamed protein product, partial [Closterium sp. NIES-54]